MKMVVTVLLLVLAFSYCHGNSSLLWSGSEKTTECAQPSFQQCVSCSEDRKEVTLHVLNVLKDPHLDQSICLKCTSQKYLLGVMEEAADKNSSFRFSGTYFNLALGWFIDAYNGVYANYSDDKSYWEILDGDLKPTTLGVSHYQPTNGETVTFNLTIDDSQV